MASAPLGTHEKRRQKYSVFGDFFFVIPIVEVIAMSHTMRFFRGKELVRTMETSKTTFIFISRVLKF